MVYVKARSDSTIPLLTQLGLAEGPIRVRPKYYHKDINVDAWGEAPAEVQWMLGELFVSMTLIHVDQNVLETCQVLSMGGSTATGALGNYGQMARAGARLGNNTGRFLPGNNYIGLNIASPINARPFRFYFAYLADPPIEIPLGTEKSVFNCNWRVIPFTQDPANIVGGIITGAQGYTLWDRTLDT